MESQDNTKTNPLIFWFNGGPGCSSLDGLLNEMGPYLIDDDGKTLRHNPYAWNQVDFCKYVHAVMANSKNYTMK